MCIFLLPFFILFILLFNIMKKNLLFLFLVVLFTSSCVSKQGETYSPAKISKLRAPAYPLVTIDPYTSAWSFSDQLNDDDVRHWTGKKHPMLGVLRVDGKSYRFMGKEETPLKVILPTSATTNWEALYTETKPGNDWYKASFNDVAWKKAKGAFGTDGMPNLSTSWTSKDIWVRRSFELTEAIQNKPVYLEYSHDDIFELYINGVEVVSTGYEWKNNVMLELSDSIKATLKPGKNIITAHCHNQTGGGYVDFGLFTTPETKISFDTKAVQKSANVMPTQTFYTFECGPVQLDLIFTSPLLMDDLELMTTPVNYITYQVKSLDGTKHDVQIYFDATPQWATNTDNQKVVSEKIEKNAITYLKTGTAEQAVLGKKGDDVRIDWGYFYLAAGNDRQASMKLGEYHTVKSEFNESGALSATNGNVSQNMQEEMPVLAYSRNLGKVDASSSNGYLMVGYDDLYSIQYFNENLMPYWKRNGKVDIYQAFEKAAGNYVSVMHRCGDFDKQLMEQATKDGGEMYAELCALSYRQAIAAHKLVESKDGELLFLSKENFSNGSIGTVDVTYPSAPLFLVYNPDLLKGMLNPIFYFSESGKWNKPFAAHDVGTYPLANGQTYGGDMPVEECGNMLTLTAAIAIMEGNADYAKKHWTVLTTWADYLKKEGLDPENQLCTDDFAGHFAHNANLSIKAIMGIAGYGIMAEMMGEKEIAEQYISAAKVMAAKWETMANDGDHYKLTFDQAGTWSQKYNLIWDKLFQSNIFPADITAKEMSYYITKQNKYGLPLDSRKTYTKSDWILWSACLTDNPEDFKQLLTPVYNYVNETTTRMPLSDWHETTDGNSVGFRARSVVGGYFMKMLENKMKDVKAASSK